MPEITIRGVTAMTGRLAVVRAKLIGDSRQSVRNEAKRVFPVTQRRVPFDKGNLKSTGRVRDAQVKGFNVGSQIIYDGPQALAIHEHESPASPGVWRGKTLNFTTAGTGVDYVGGPLREASSGMDERLAKDMKL